jgi:multisubunit Na+/H+ antiporter MnhE subunit
MNRVVWIGGWLGLSLTIGAPVMMILANFFGGGDEAMINLDFVVPSMVVMGIGIIVSVVALLRRWNPPKRLRAPAIVAMSLVLPAFAVLSWAATEAYEMGCGGG